mmetsp:Transcript_17481/g.52412  ORF Transcript_17481/g.52412 Transcript_17481/m.52412 type:complete len:444 (+) Transcript_17481:350-1681(+)
MCFHLRAPDTHRHPSISHFHTGCSQRFPRPQTRTGTSQGLCPFLSLNPSRGLSLSLAIPSLATSLGSHRHQIGFRRFWRFLKLILVGRDEAGVHVAIHEVLSGQDQLVVVDCGGHSRDDGLGQSTLHANNGLLAGVSPDDELPQQRVVVGWHQVLRVQMAVHAHVGPPRRQVAGDPPWAGTEVLEGILRVDAALDGMPLQLDVILGDGELLTHGHLDLLLDEVQPRHHLRHRVLYLDTGVHLHEVEALFLPQELDGAHAPVPNGNGCVHCRIAHRLPHLGGEGGRGGLFQQLLVAALDAAVALAQVDGVAELVGQHLELNVARVLHVSLQIHRPVAEGRLRLLAGFPHQGQELLLLSGQPHATPSAASCGFDHDGKPNLSSDGESVLLALNQPVAAGHCGHPRCLHGVTRGGLVAHDADVFSLRADELKAVRGAGIHKRGVLR